jgi:hypothetical protein
VKTHWTEEEIRALGVRTDLVTACAIVYGVSRTTAYERFRRGELHFPALRLGHRVVVPVRPLLELLGLEPAADQNAPGNTGAGPATGPASANSVSPNNWRHSNATSDH